MELWTKEHAITVLPALAVMLLAAVILRHFLKNKPIQVRMIPFQVLSLLIVALEIGKQAVSFSRGYDLYHIPLHFCSLFIFMMPLMAFYRGKHEQTIRGITTALCASVFLLMLIYPVLIYSAGNIRDYFEDYSDFHTVTFHNIVMFAFVLIVALDLYEPKGENHWKQLAIFYICFCVISAIMAQVLKTNYNNFYKCNVPPLETLRQNIQNILGYGVAQVAYVLIVTVVQSLFVQGCYALCRLLRKKTKLS